MTTDALFDDVVPTFPVHPGGVLAEELTARGLTQRELASRIGRPAKMVNEVINGKKGITADTALDLEQALGITAQSWLNLQTAYELTMARQRRAQRSA